MNAIVAAVVSVNQAGVSDWAALILSTYAGIAGV